MDSPFEHSPIDQTKRTDYVDIELLENEEDDSYCDWLDLPQYIQGEPFGGVAFAFDNQGRCSDEFGFHSDGNNAYEIILDSKGKRKEISINSEQACEHYKFYDGNISEIQITERIALGYNTHPLTIRYDADGKVDVLHV